MPTANSSPGRDRDVAPQHTSPYRQNEFSFRREDLVAIPLSDLRRIMEGRILDDNNARFVFPTNIQSQSSEEISQTSSPISSQSNSAGNNRAVDQTGRRGRWFSRFPFCFTFSRARSRSHSPSRSPESAEEAGSELREIELEVPDVEAEIGEIRRLRRQNAIVFTENRIRSMRAGSRAGNGDDSVEIRHRRRNRSENNGNRADVQEGIGSGGAGNARSESENISADRGPPFSITVDDLRSVWSNDGDNRSVRSNETETVSNASLSSLRVNVPWPEVSVRSDLDSESRRMWMRHLDRERATMTSEIESAMHSLILDELNGVLQGRGPRYQRYPFSLGDEENWTYEQLLELDKHNVLIGLKSKEFGKLDTKPQRATDPRVECRICIEETVAEEIITTLPCQHSYHEECITPWLSSHRTCPICRFEFPRSSTLEGK